MLRKYKDFLFESLLLESALVYSDKFKKLIKDIDSPVAKALIDIESKDLKVTNNFIDIGQDKEQISFIPDRKAQELLSPENKEKMATYTGDGGFLSHGSANTRIFGLLEYEPTGEHCYHPSEGETGEVIKKTKSPTSENIYLKVKFQGGISIVNQRCVRYDDVSKLPFIRNRQSIRVGRGIKSILNSAQLKFSDPEIETFVNKYKTEYDKMNDIYRYFELVKGDDIAHWYNYRNYELEQRKGPLSNSCMSAVPETYFQIYTSNPDVCQLLILKTEDGAKIKGRALVWTLKKPEGVTYVDRIYVHNDADVELFRQYAKSKGWFYKARNESSSTGDMVGPDGSSVNSGLIFTMVKEGGYKKYPYLDTLKYYDGDSGRLANQNSGGDYILENTGGGHAVDEDCDNCGGEGSIECYDCDGRGTENCNDCDGDGRVECGECEGNKKVECSTCDGNGDIECDDCDGSGEVDGEKCESCSGKGRKECTDCDGEGKTDCKECDGRGTIECDNCGGSGEVECSNCEGNGRNPCPECNG